MGKIAGPRRKIGSTEERADLCRAITLNDSCETDLILNRIELGTHIRTDGMIPLHFAVSHGDGYQEIVHVLLKHGADPLRMNEEGVTAIQIAKECGFPKIAQILVQHVDQMYLAVKSGDPKIVHRLLTDGVNPSQANSRGRIPLHLAVKSGHSDIAHMLLEYGANPSRQNKHGDTALHLAAKYGHPELVCTMLEGGVDPLQENEDGTTAVSLCRIYTDVKYQDCFKLLMIQLAVNMQLKDGCVADDFNWIKDSDTLLGRYYFENYSDKP
jgi:ankyrin repeat protein